MESRTDPEASTGDSSNAHSEVSLEEYRQLCEYHRHDDIIKWTILGLGYTGAGALVSFAIDGDHLTWLSSVLLPLAIMAVVSVTGIYFDVDKDTRKRLIRLHEVEEKMNIKNHRCFPNPKDKLRNHCLPVNQIVGTACFVFVGCMIALIVMTCDLPILR